MRLLWVGLVLVTAVARLDAQPLRIELHDLPGTHGHWQEGVAIIPAPASSVRRWLTDYDHWPELFDDITESELLGSTPDGRAVVRFHSAVVNRTITIVERLEPWGLAYEGRTKHASFQGKIFVEPLGPSTTRVVMQSTTEVHGALRPFVSLNLRRVKTREMMQADLNALYRLSGQK